MFDCRVVSVFLVENGMSRHQNTVVLLNIFSCRGHSDGIKRSNRPYFCIIWLPKICPARIWRLIVCLIVFSSSKSPFRGGHGVFSVATEKEKGASRVSAVRGYLPYRGEQGQTTSVTFWQGLLKLVAICDSSRLARLSKNRDVRGKIER